MTTLSEINTALVAQLPTVVLSATTFGADSVVGTMLPQYFVATNGQIEIDKVEPSNYSFDANAGVIQFSGSGTGIPFAGMQITRVLITAPGGVVQLQIEAHPPGDCTLSQIFSDLNSPIAQQLPFSQAGLLFTSISDTGDDNPTTPGFYFQGNIDFSTPPLSLLQFLFPGISGPQVWGTIAMTGGWNDAHTFARYVPETVLVFDTSADSVTLGPFTLSGPTFKIFSVPFFNTFDQVWQTDSFVRIVTHLRFTTKAGTTAFQLLLDVRDLSSDIFFEADVGLSLAGALDEIATLVGRDSLEIPGFQLTKPDQISLENIKITFDPNGQNKIKLIAVEVGTAKPDGNSEGEKLPLWGDVYLENIDLVFHLTPKDGGGYDVDGEISGTVEDWLQLQAGFASDHHYTFYGALLKPVSLRDAYKALTGTTRNELPDLDLATLNFSLDRPASGTGVSYNGEIEIDAKWPIVNDRNFTLELDGVRFTINHTASPDDTTVNAAAVIAIDDYSVGADALYDTAKGWIFDGSATATDDSATLADLLTKIENAFPIDTSKPIALPPFLTGWYLQQIAAHFETVSKDFDFTANIGNASVPALEIDFGIHLHHEDSTFSKTFDAEVSVATESFAVDVNGEITQTTATNPPSTTLSFAGRYTASKPPKLSDFLAWIAQAANVDANLPAELNIDAEANDFAIAVEQKDQDPQIIELAGEFGLQVEGSDWNLYFAYTNLASFTADGPRALVDGQPAYVVGAALGGLLDLSRLPLVGKIAGIDKFRIDKLGFFYTNAQFADQNAQLHFTVPAIGDPGKVAPDATAAVLTQPGFTLMAVFGNQPNTSGTGVTPAGTMPLPVATGKPTKGQSPGFAQKAASPTDPIHWLDLNKTIGPVSLQKIGVGYEKSTNAHALGTIAFYVDGAFTIAGFAMALDRLGVSIDVPNPSGGITFNPIDDIAFHLGGLFVSYKSPAFQISGGFITLPGGGVNFIGEFSVVAGEFGLQAYGGFSNQDGHPSLFLFVHVEAPIGGPPFLFINGLAGGFGVNRAFKLPTFDQLTNYPFLPASSAIPGPSQLTGDPSSQLATMTTALTTLAQYVPVQEGEYWVAAGLDVSSFEMIEVSAVLSVAFGVNFQVGVVGTASMTLPVEEPEPIAYIQIDFEVVFSPSDGLFAAFGKITPASFIYGGMVHLSGGFAFQTWFSGDNEGNYVVTVGGYNLQYNKPSIYPDVPRLQATFGINSLNVTGDSYFALVPHALMAGMDIHATWSLGPLDAWFDAGIDFLLNWKPFHYDADAHIQIGISLTIKILFVRVRITVHAGVDLEVWGPPFGGRASVDLDIVSFTISFGDAPVTKSVGWTDFRAFLPSVSGDPPPHHTGFAAVKAVAADSDNKPLVNITVPEGLAKIFKPGESADGLDWLIDPNGFAIATQSAAPCTDAAFNAVGHLSTFTAAQYVDPGDLTASVKRAIEQKGSAPFFAYAPPPSAPMWNALAFGITPMGVQNIQSLHKVTANKLDDDGNVIGPVNDVIVELDIKSMSRALWGNNGATTPSLQGGQELITGALAGFTIVPMVWFPKRTTFISYYDLVFDTNDLFLEQDTLPAFNTTPFSNPDAIYAGMDDGTLFASTATARAGIVALLRQSSIASLTLSNDNLINTGQYTSDPMLGYLSSTSETHL